MTTPTPLAFNQKGEGWHLNPRRQRWLRLGIGFTGVLGLASGLTNLADGDNAPGVGLLLFGGAMLTTAVMMSGAVRRARRSTSRRPPAPVCYCRCGVAASAPSWDSPCSACCSWCPSPASAP